MHDLGRALQPEARERNDLMVIASFSGGGSRAAALAHAALSELDQAASSALPLVFSPLTLRNFAGQCTTARPKLLADSNASRTARVRLVRSELESFAHADRQFVHLVDGGVSDNLGLRRVADFVEQVGGVRPVLAAMHDDRNGPVSMPRRIVFIAVNSERSASLPIDKQAECRPCLKYSTRWCSEH